MGAYLPKPVTECHSEDLTDERFRVGSSSMQGWRVNQEDAHNAILKFDPRNDSSYFAVYDGHGGTEVSLYSADKLPDFLKNHPKYAEGKGDMKQALTEAFEDFDKTLVERDVVAHLKTLSAGYDPNNPNDEPDDPNETNNEMKHLFEEADMPLEQVISGYETREEEEKAAAAAAEADGQGGSGAGSSSSSGPKRTAASRLLADEGSSKKPISPFLRGKRTSAVTKDGDGEAVNTHIRFDAEDGKDADNDAKESEETKEEKKVETAQDTEEPKKEEESVKEEKESVKKDEEAVKKEEAEDSKEDNSKSKQENGKQLVNGHVANGISKDQEAETADKENGNSNGNGDVSCGKGKSKGKGKGKGKGKSSLVVPKAKSAEDEDAEEELPPAPKPEKKTGKSAEDLYRNLLDADVDEEEEDSEDDEEDANFGHELDETSDDDDDDEDEDEKEGAEEDGEEEESDTEDEDEDEDEESFGGEFNEEPGNDSGCTAVVALLVGKELLVANAGDSRCVVSRGGEAVEMSFDHKPEDEPELKRIEKAGGKVTPDGRVNGGLNLSRAIGDHAYKTNKSLPLSEQMISPVPDIRALTLDPATDNFMILACDGIWNSMSSQEVIDFVDERIRSNPDKLSSICEELFEHCLAPDTLGDGTGCDNMTAVIVQFKDHHEANNASDSKNSASTTSSSSSSSSSKSQSPSAATPAEDEKETAAEEDTLKRPRVDEDADGQSQSKKSKVDTDEAAASEASS